MNFLTTVFLGIVASFYPDDGSILEQIKANGELRVVTRPGLTTYYKGPNGAAGLEYELVKRFADELGVELRLFTTDGFTEIIHLVANHQVHFAAAGLVITKPRLSLVRFGPHYQDINQQLIYRQGKQRPPNDLTDLTTKHPLNVTTDSHQIDILTTLKKDYPQLTWKERAKLAPSLLLKKVWKKEIEYTLADSNEVVQLLRFYPELKIGFNLPDINHLAWAFPRSNDNSLYLATIQFFNHLDSTGELEQLIERYYGHINEAENFDSFNTQIFHRRIKERLPKYQKSFERVSSNYNLDWRLLAAIGYQESQWNPKAISKTGVKGLMMLTEATARENGVNNRENPFESIQGGIKYFAALKKRIPKEIQEPDRTWFTLAAYNVGLGHLRDARKITKQQGDNPNRWLDVKKHLPKLTEEYWFRQTKYGYARGHEPVHFVQSVRRFYDILALVDW